MLIVFGKYLKTLLGIISLIFCIVILLIKPFYIEDYILLFLIPAIGLIVPVDSIKNNSILGIITFILVISILFISINGYLNAYNIMHNLYLANQINHVPTINDIATCTNSYLMIILYALYNIICGIAFFNPPTPIGEYKEPILIEIKFKD